MTTPEENTNKEREEWEEEFNEKMNVLRRDMGTKKVYDFGYKTQRGKELFTVTNWGNIKDFIRTILTRERRAVAEEIKEMTKCVEGDAHALMVYDEICYYVDSLLEPTKDTTSNENER